MRSVIPQLAVVAVAAVCLTGCGSSTASSTGSGPTTSTSAATTSTGAGTTSDTASTTFKPTSKAFSITTPAGWKGINSSMLSGAAGEFIKRNPDFASLKGELQQMASNPDLVFFIDTTRKGKTIALVTGFAVNGIARTSPLNVELSNAAAERAVAKQIKGQMSEVHIKAVATKATLAGHPALTLTYLVPVNTTAGSVTAHEADTIMVWDSQLYVVSLTAPLKDSPGYRSTFAGILGSFKLG